ncbi:unnamed protein product [Angiostrongylus costaricensis]|uniref:Uncharacterized protein n=1 Tax=Angiostrongylus costaricensis TaxID=334426 RepID=A0A0R3PK85_ANGCS|nr:unnamed protein product [Angiostrongylus costaricensis]
MTHAGQPGPPRCCPNTTQIDRTIKFVKVDAHQLSSSITSDIFTARSSEEGEEAEYIIIEENSELAINAGVKRKPIIGLTEEASFLVHF